MKDKNVAGILALFFGWLGIHRFYLGQVGLGIVYIFLMPIMGFIALIDAIIFFSMDENEFDYKYNRRYVDRRDRYQERDTDFDRREYERRRRQKERSEYRERAQRENYRRDRPPQRQKQYERPAQKKNNPYKLSGIRKYKDFDYDGAIEDFNKALEIDDKDVAVHFNLACSYSLNEDQEKAFFHLDKAVDYGFNDFKRIKEHDALAYLRIQPQFEEFERNGFRLIQKLEAPKQDYLELPVSSAAPAANENPQKMPSSPDLLDQLQKLGELRDKGLLTEEEFVAQKKRLLNSK